MSCHVMSCHVMSCNIIFGLTDVNICQLVEARKNRLHTNTDGTSTSGHGGRSSSVRGVGSSRGLGSTAAEGSDLR
jgi:hypothetical protein